MNDAFVRQRLNQLTGLTKFTQKTAPLISVSASTWTPFVIAGLDTPLKQHLIISAYKITTTEDDFTTRFIVDGAKIFPYASSMLVLSGVDDYLQFHVQVPPALSFSIEVYSPTGGNATLDYLSVVEVDTLDHS